MLLLVAPAAGQTLDLDPAPPMPALRGESVVLSVSAVLKEEIDELDRPAEGASEPMAQAVRGARRELRRIAFNLLARATADAPLRDVLALHGFRVADVRRRVDLRLERFLEGSAIGPNGEVRPVSVREKDRVTRLLARFAEVAPKAMASASLEDLKQVDGAVAVALEPLIDALALLESRPTGDALASGWPTAEELNGLGVASATGSRRGDVPAEGDPCDPASRHGCGPATLAALDAACAQADGSAGAIDASDASDRQERFAAAARLSSASRVAAWLSEPDRQALDRRGADLVDGTGSVALVRAQAALVAARVRLGETKPKPEDTKRLDASLRAALFPSVDGGVALTDSPEELARVVQRMAESVDLGTLARTGQDGTVAKEFRTARRDAVRRAAKAEEAAWSKFEEMLADEDALVHPAHTGLVRDQRESLRDIERVERAQALIDAVGGVRPQATRGLSNRMRTIIRWLGEPNRRADALLAFDTLALHVRMFLPMPYERELRGATDEALRFTAGRAAELVQAIDLRRAEWADAWADGAATGPESQRLVLLYRLCRAMEDLSQGEGPGSRDSAAALSRWGAFHATKAALAPAMIDVAALTQLATATAIAGDQDRLGRELDRIDRDAPLARLVGRLARDLEPWLATRPTDILGQLSAVREAPAGDAWGVRHRMRLAALLRAARELDYARRAGHAEDEKTLLEHLSRLAQSTLEALGDERSPLPTMPALPSAEEGPTSGRRRGS